MNTKKFRGKREGTGEWVYGDLLTNNGNPIIVLQVKRDYISRSYVNDESVGGGTHWAIETPAYLVDPSTVGQATGIESPKRKTHLEAMTYEGDVFRQEYGDAPEYLVVMWINQRAAFYLIPTAHYHILQDNDCSEEPEFQWLFNDAALYDFSIDCGLTKVGNIHDNPELLEK